MASEFQQFKPKRLLSTEDPITGRVVIINPNRGFRRVEFHGENLKRRRRREECYYCKGGTPSTLFFVDEDGEVRLLHETESLAAGLASLRASDTEKVSAYYQMVRDISGHTLPGEGWLARTFLNLVPPLTAYPELSLVTAVSPKYHYRQMHRIPGRVLGAVIVSWRVMEQLATSNRMTVVPFINGGKRPESGQSIFCFHSQVYITQTPPLYRKIARRRRKHGCGVCKLLRKRTLSVYANSEFKVVVHPAPIRNRSLLIAPKRCVARLG
ncbi:MAG: hypothetical protein ACE5JA_05525, partial [bacterium]